MFKTSIIQDLMIDFLGFILRPSVRKMEPHSLDTREAFFKK